MKKPELKILRKQKLLPKVGLSDTTVWRMEKEGKFPKRIRLGATACGWFEHEVDEWLRSRRSS